MTTLPAAVDPRLRPLRSALRGAVVFATLALAAFAGVLV
jgi:hypothetical protein